MNANYKANASLKHSSTMQKLGRRYITGAVVEHSSSGSTVTNRLLKTQALAKQLYRHISTKMD